tara:strand:+ start:2442 stop:4163 length:1722 start_codon:yes stop_codon:yes gene_type:complete
MESRLSKEELSQTLSGLRAYFIYAGLFSAAINILMLTPIIYMLQVYDRVVASGSLSTLAMLSLIMVGLLLATGGFEWVRTLILIRASNRIEKDLRARVSDATFKRAMATGGMVASTQSIADLASLRQFLTGNGLFAFFDAPWFPIYVGVMFLFHPWFGFAGIISGIIMVAFTLTTEILTSKPLQEANGDLASFNNQTQSTLRNSEVIAAMGMGENIRSKLDLHADKALFLQAKASSRAGALVSISKSIRLILQSTVLGLGAFLALRQEISPGMMIAGSLLLGRALAPIDLLTGSWKAFSVARKQYARLGELLSRFPPEEQTMSLPTPEGKLEAEQIVVAPPGTKNYVIKGVSFALEPGEALGIIGPSGAGKSTLARALLGIWPTTSGTVRLDGSDIASWERVMLGPHVGYLPQNIELFDGTIADNICRFGSLDPEKVVAASITAGVHELILSLPEGYDTKLVAGGGSLSGGQRQRIGLARAVYDSPNLIILDEPNSNLDDAGEKELISAIDRIKAKKSTLVIISHRTNLLNAMDKLLALKDGLIATFGTKDKVLRQLIGPSVLPKTASGSRNG